MGPLRDPYESCMKMRSGMIRFNHPGARARSLDRCLLGCSLDPCLFEQRDHSVIVLVQIKQRTKQMDVTMPDDKVTILRGEALCRMNDLTGVTVKAIRVK